MDGRFFGVFEVVRFFFSSFFGVITLNFVYVFVYLKGEDVNRTLEGGRKPLHYAADCGQLEILEFLLLKGADINVRTSIYKQFRVSFSHTYEIGISA